MLVGYDKSIMDFCQSMMFGTNDNSNRNGEYWVQQCLQVSDPLNVLHNHYIDYLQTLLLG